MRNKVILAMALVGGGLALMPALGHLLAPNARCVGCRRDFRVGAGRVMCGRCRCLMDASWAKQLFDANPDVPQMPYIPIYLDGPVPSDVTVVD